MINNKSLGSRMKNYEKDCEFIIGNKPYIVIRIDGHKFSKFTKNYKKPFDDIISKAMELTTIELFKYFDAVEGYTQSDEITIVLEKPKNDKNHKYNGRTQKIASLVSSYTTMKFNNHLFKLTGKLAEAVFDARVFAIKDISEVYYALSWRRRDAIRNSKSVYSQSFCSHKV